MTKIYGEKSISIIPINTSNSNETLFLLVHHQAGHWSFPKGHAKEEEKKEETARR